MVITTNSDINMDINLKDYVRPVEAMEIVGLKRTRFYERFPWLVKHRAMEKRGNNTFIKKEALFNYNRMMHNEVYG